MKPKRRCHTSLCDSCLADERMPNDLFCPDCASNMFNLRDSGWKIIPPKCKEERTHKAQLLRYYSAELPCSV